MSGRPLGASRNGRRSLLSVSAAAMLVNIPGRGVASAAPLDPNAFSSLGTLQVPAGSITINTDTLSITGAATFTGVLQSQGGGGNPDIAVFTFADLFIF